MMLPPFERWLGELCMYYTRPNWPTDENVAAAFRDVKHMDAEALEFIGSYIRTNCEEWPKSLSAVMVKGYAAWRVQQIEEQRINEREKSITLPTPEQWALHKSRLEDVMRALRTGVKPPWFNEHQEHGQGDSCRRRGN